MDQIMRMVDANGGIISSRQITAMGMARQYLRLLVLSGKLRRVARGVYARPDAWDDEFYAWQARYDKGIFCHSSALFLSGYGNGAPDRFEMTFPAGYHVQVAPGVVARHCVKRLWRQGVVEYTTMTGAKVRGYCIERTLCDMLRGKSHDVQRLLPAMKKYLLSRERDLGKLFEYGETLRVAEKVKLHVRIILDD